MVLRHVRARAVGRGSRCRRVRRRAHRQVGIISLVVRVSLSLISVDNIWSADPRSQQCQQLLRRRRFTQLPKGRAGRVVLRSRPAVEHGTQHQVEGLTVRSVDLQALPRVIGRQHEQVSRELVTLCLRGGGVHRACQPDRQRVMVDRQQYKLLFLTGYNNLD